LNWIWEDWGANNRKILGNSFPQKYEQMNNKPITTRKQMNNKPITTRKQMNNKLITTRKQLNRQKRSPGQAANIFSRRKKQQKKI